MDADVRFPRTLSYELTGAVLAGGGVLSGAALVAGTQVVELSMALIVAASASAGGAFFGKYVRYRSERRATERLLRQYLWDAGCVLNSSPLEFIRLATAHVIHNDKKSGFDDERQGETDDRLRGKAAQLSRVAAVVAYALDPQNKGKNIASDPTQWERYRGAAEWVVPLLNSCGIEHQYRNPAVAEPGPYGAPQEPARKAGAISGQSGTSDA